MVHQHGKKRKKKNPHENNTGMPRTPLLKMTKTISKKGSYSSVLNQYHKGHKNNRDLNSLGELSTGKQRYKADKLNQGHVLKMISATKAIL